jgi:CII-binding regulator of phage lambda lysogenization HflD
MMTLEKRVEVLEALMEGVSQRLSALERRMDHQTASEDVGQSEREDLKKGMEALEKQTPANSASREVMWRRIEALEGAPSEDLPPIMAEILRRLAAVEERMR